VVSNVARACAVVGSLLLPVPVLAQDGAYIQGRLVGMQQQLNEISARVEQLKEQDRQLQQRVEAMRTRMEARLQRLEQGAGSRPGRR
jgi:TolA-binding protein